MTINAALRVGIAKANITPPVGISHAGWGAQSHERAAGVDYPMYVAALWVSDGDNSVVICDFDLGIITAEESTLLREQISSAVDVPVQHIRISYTHTHAGPLALREARHISGGRELIEGYAEGVRVQAVGAVREAALTARPARMAAAFGSSDVGVNRRMEVPGDGRTVVGEAPDGYSDDRVLVVRFDDKNHDPIAAIIGYGAHPITLAFQNEYLSPDYPGFTRVWHERLTGAPTLFLQGCAGDQMAEFGLTGDRSVPRSQGKRLAAAGAEVFLRLRPHVAGRRFSHVVESGAPLGLLEDIPADTEDATVDVLSDQISLPVRDVPDIQTAEETASRWIQAAHEAQRGGATDEIAAARFEAKRAEMIVNWSKWLAGKNHASVELQTIRIGNLGLVGFPGEPFARLGADVREASPLGVTHLAGYSNGWHGYVPTKGAFSYGGYEVEVGSAFAPEAGDILVGEALRQLNELTGG